MMDYNDFWAWIFFGGIILPCIFLIVREDYRRMRETRADKKIMKTAEEIRNEIG